MANYAPKAKAKSSKRDEKDIPSEVRDRAQAAWDYDKMNREEAVIDLRFLANDQWPSEVRTARQQSNRPVLTFNMLDKFIRQVTNPIREADLAIKVAPVDDNDDPALAKIYNGLLRQIQDASSAHAVYAHTVENQAACGIGWFRICRDYIDEDSFEQELYLERIDNPLSVFVDPAARSPTREDADWMMVMEMWPKEKFKQKWPGKITESVDQPGVTTNDSALLWNTTDQIRVAEYYRKVPMKRTIAKLRTGQVIDVTNMTPKRLERLDIVATRDSDGYKIEKYFVSGAEVLEGPYDELGKFIPLVPAIGSEIALENGIYRSGVIRRARDAQQMYNFNRTATAEWIGQAPKAPYIVTDAMVAPYIGEWETANVTNRPFLRYRPDKNAPNAKPERNDPPQLPTALVQDGITAAEDLKATIGIYDANLGNKSNENSGVAIQRRQAQGDTATFHFADNFKLSLEHAGRILIDLIPKVYDSERVLRILGEDGKEEAVRINVAIPDDKGGAKIINDLSVAKFDVRVNIGPSYATRRIEAVESLTNTQRALPPQQAALISDLIMKNQDFPGADEAAKRLLSTIPPEVRDFDPAKPPPPKPPDPIVLAKLHEIASKIENMMADTESKRATAYKTLVEADIADGQADGLVMVPQVSNGSAQQPMPTQAPQPAPMPPPGGLPQ